VVVSFLGYLLPNHHAAMSRFQSGRFSVVRQVYSCPFLRRGIIGCIHGEALCALSAEWRLALCDVQLPGAPCKPSVGLSGMTNSISLYA
jgi:hypothetical protein